MRMSLPGPALRFVIPAPNTSLPPSRRPQLGSAGADLRETLGRGRRWQGRRDSPRRLGEESGEADAQVAGQLGRVLAALRPRLASGLAAGCGGGAARTRGTTPSPPAGSPSLGVHWEETLGALGVCWELTERGGADGTAQAVASGTWCPKTQGAFQQLLWVSPRWLPRRCF